MLLTTHFLDETDVLADHVVILSKGTLRAEGSVASLKNSLGGGYKIVHPRNESALRDEALPATVNRHQDYNNTVYQASSTAALSQMVSSFTRNGVAQYTVHGPTIEDVFLGLSDEMQTEEGAGGRMPAFGSGLEAGKGRGPLQQTKILFLKRLTVLK